MCSAQNGEKHDSLNLIDDKTRSVTANISWYYSRSYKVYSTLRIMPLLKRSCDRQSADGFSRNCIIYTVFLLLLTCYLKRSILTTANTMYNGVVDKQERFAVEAGEGVCDLVMDSFKT